MNAIESANMNKETLDAMKKGADVLKGIHGKLSVFPAPPSRDYGPTRKLADYNHCSLLSCPLVPHPLHP